MLKLINWIKDGKYRIQVLGLLYSNSYLSSELASKLNLNRSSMSRILRNMREKRLIDYVSNDSRTRSYVITPLGKNVYENLLEGLKNEKF